MWTPPADEKVWSPPADEAIEKPSIPWSDVPKNAVEDVKGIGRSMAEQGKRILDPTGVGEAIMTGNTEPIQKAAFEPLHQIKGFGEQIVNTATHPIETFKKHPVSTGMLAAPLLGKLMGGAEIAPEMGAEIPKAAPIAEGANRIPPPAPNPINLPPEAANILKESPRPSIPPPEASSFSKLADQVKGKIPKEVAEPMDQVSDYLQKQYGKVSEKPGFANTIGELLTRKAQGMRLKEMGISPGQARKIVEKYGENKLFELSDLARDKGITEPVLGYKVGRKIEELKSNSGNDIGQIRKTAASRGAIHNPEMLVKSIQAELDPVYLGKGVNSGQKGAYLKALQDIKSAASDPETLAKKITNLNDYASKNKLTQTTGAISDVANAASRANNNLIKKVLTPAEADNYSAALKDYAASKLFKKFYGFKVGRELAGRSGVGGMIKNMYQWGMDTFGNKFVENVSDGVGNALKKNPGMVKNPKMLMDEVLNQMSDTLDEIGDEFVQ